MSSSMRFRRILIAALGLGLAVLSVRPPVALAGAQSGGVVDPSAVLGFGTRAGAMGNAFVALGDDATAVFWNPAALDLSRRKEIFGQYSQAFFDKSSYNLVAYKHPLGRFGTVGGGLIIEGVQDLTRRDVNAANIGNFNVNKTNLMFSYGKEVVEGFYLGSTLRVLRQQIAEFSGTGVGLDVGTLYRFTNRYVEYSRAYLRLAREQIRQDAEREFSLGRRANESGHSNGHAMAEFLKTHGQNGALRDLRLWFDEGVKLYDAGRIKDAVPFFEAVIRNARANLLTDRLALGLNIQNLLRPSLKLKSTADRVPTIFKFGSAYRIADWFNLALDLDVPSKGDHRVHFGAEWKPIEWLAVRAGLDHKDPTFGFGFRYQDLKIDYSFTPSDDLDNDFQRVGISYEFGKSHGDVAVERIQRGLTLQSRREYSSARQEWESAQKLQPTNRPPRRYIQETEEAYRKNVTEPWSAAERLVAAGRLSEAHPILQAILTFDPAFDPALKAMGSLKAAVPAYAESHFNAGYLKYLQNDYVSALEEMTHVLFFVPEHASARQYRDAARKRSDEEAGRAATRELFDDAVRSYRAGRWPDALSRFQAVLRRDPTHASAGGFLDQIAQFQAADFSPEERKLESDRFFRIAQADFLDDHTIEAEQAVSNSLSLWPDNADAQNLLTRIEAMQNRILLGALQAADERMDRGDIDAAVAGWRRVLDKSPRNFDAMRRLERHVDDIRAFVEASLRLAERLEKDGALVDALKLYNRVLAVDPFNAAAAERRAAVRPAILSKLERIYQDAESLYRSGELERSMALLSDLMAIDPDLTQARDLKEIAREKFELNVSLVRVKRLYNEGLEFFRQRNYEQAVATWRQIVAQPTDLPEVRDLAQEAAARIAEAVREAERERAASFYDEYLRRGDAFLAEGRDVEALEAFKSAQELQPENVSIQWRIATAKKSVEDRLAAWVRQGTEAFELGRLDDAESLFRAAVHVDPDRADALAGIDRVLAARSAAAAAAAPPAPAEEPAAPVETRETPKPPDTRDRIDRILARAADLRRKAAAVEQSRPDLALSRAKNALEACREALRIDAANEVARQVQSAVTADIARLQKVLKEKNAADIQKFLYSGMGHYRAGRLNEAIADWNRVLSLDADHAQAREYIRRAEKKLELLNAPEAP